LEAGGLIRPVPNPTTTRVRGGRGEAWSEGEGTGQGSGSTGWQITLKKLECSRQAHMMCLNRLAWNNG